MISVKNLTKKYGSKIAVDDISFDVSKGEVIGFLGVNGAGKTTTMRVLAGYMPPTSGQINIDELNCKIGYLAETAPLYTDMRVNEYLLFRARIKGLSKREAKIQIKEVLEKCWICDVEKNMIASLSKGYRQRVALADALLGHPQILILDEPTVGLDPNQIIKIRELIVELGKTHTILLSSHILPEVEMICPKVIIIHEGKIVAKNTTKILHEQMGLNQIINLELKGAKEADVAAVLSKLDHIKKINKIQKKDGDIHVELMIESDIREKIFKTIVEQGWVLQELKISKTK